MGFAHFNIVLVHLIKGNKIVAIDVYNNALVIIRKIDNPKETLEGALKDIEDNLSKFSKQK